MKISTLCWFRRDLRIEDHAALHHATAEARERGGRTLGVFVFDREILDGIPDRADRRVSFLHGAVAALRESLRAMGSDLLVLHGNAAESIPDLARALAPQGLAAVHVSHDHEPRRLERDRLVSEELRRSGLRLASWKDIVVFEKDEVLSTTGTPLRVFTPYRKAWMKRLESEPDVALRTYGFDPEVLVPAHEHPFVPTPTLSDLGFEHSPGPVPAGSEDAARSRLRDFSRRMDGYAAGRNFPSEPATSMLGVDLRFGTLSVRSAVREARGRILSGDGEGAETWLSQLVWREFHQMLLHHFPLSEREDFVPRTRDVVWDDPDGDPVAALRLAAWKEGRTGYPFVDASMRELLATGWMHNRARMVVASFLTKDLHIHWKRGERHFARHLLDYDLAQNVGGWQWAASTGADGQPWFRVFHPCTQGERFDERGVQVRRWCPEISALPDRWLHRPFEAPVNILEFAGLRLGKDYPEPLVDHAVERLSALERFGRKGL